MQQFSHGDKVSWNTPQGKTTGTVVKEITSDTTIGDHSVRASKGEPQYEVKSDSTGKTAIHKPASLSKNG